MKERQFQRWKRDKWRKEGGNFSTWLTYICSYFSLTAGRSRRQTFSPILLLRGQAQRYWLTRPRVHRGSCSSWVQLQAFCYSTGDYPCRPCRRCPRALESPGSPLSNYSYALAPFTMFALLGGTTSHAILCLQDSPGCWPS